MPYLFKIRFHQIFIYDCLLNKEAGTFKITERGPKSNAPYQYHFGEIGDFDGVPKLGTRCISFENFWKKRCIFSSFNRKFFQK